MFLTNKERNGKFLVIIPYPPRNTALENTELVDKWFAIMPHIWKKDEVMLWEMVESYLDILTEYSERERNEKTGYYPDLNITDTDKKLEQKGLRDMIEDALNYLDPYILQILNLYGPSRLINTWYVNDGAAFYFESEDKLDDS